MKQKRKGTETRFISLKDVTFRKRDVLLLPGTFWEIRTGQNWAILGENGSGKSVLARSLKGDVPIVRGELIRHVPEAAVEGIGYLSFELLEEILLREDRFEDAHAFSGWGRTLTTGEMLEIGTENGAFLDPFDDILGIRPLLDRSIRVLSNGEIRKVLITRALLSRPKLLILDEPFAGLDAASRDSLAQAISVLMARGTQIILVTQRLEEVIPGISHVLIIREGQIALTGRREQVLRPEALQPFSGSGISLPTLPRPIPSASDKAVQKADILVDMKNVHVAFGKVTVLDRLTWSVRRGENWAVVGPNGSGKSTLLALITGDNLQVYANDVRLFGHKRGGGESIWEIRQRIGLVSPELQLRYRKPVSVREVVLSGLFDSIGLYRKVSAEQKVLASSWLACLGMNDRSERPFNLLSYGEKRLVLIARAMIKSPELLILDEPCQGLDRSNREMVLALMEEIGRRSSTTMIYVTHHEREIIPSIQHVLSLGGER
ncbi:MAG: putative ABC transporter ATP-binding protein YlmA [Syntrophus sp. PtaU1.Bin208]|nr:MAG: putative ABC transporter ATP-binding protein YlmA [Syntrophus sp. PtaU1.Bin208]